METEQVGSTEQEQVGSTEQMYKALNIKAPEVKETPVAPEVKEEQPQTEPSTEGKQAVEAPVTEVAQEPSTEQSTETPPETPVEPTETIFEINDINQRFETSFKDEGEMRLALEGLQRIKGLEEQVAELDAVKQENLLIKENLDPMKYFSSEDEFKASLFKKQYPDKDAAVAYKLLSSDLSQMQPKDLIAYEMMLNTPGVTKAEADEAVVHKYNIEEGEVDPLNTTRMKIDGATAKRNIDAFSSQVTLPEKTDVDSLVAQQKELLEQKKAKLTEAWGGIGKEAERTLNDLAVSGKDADGTDWSFTYSMSKDFPAEVTQSMVDYMAQTGIDLTEDSVRSMSEAMQEKYIYKNIDKIFTAFREDVLAKAEEDRLIKQHNPGTPNTEAPPSTDGKSTVSDQILTEMNKGGFARTNIMNKKQ